MRRHVLELTACNSDPTASTLHSTLLLHSSQPYIRMLNKWISTGYLSDPFDEFMVKESGHITKGVLESDYTDEYWERRYTVSILLEARGTLVGAGLTKPAPRRLLTRILIESVWQIRFYTLWRSTTSTRNETPTGRSLYTDALAALEAQDSLGGEVSECDSRVRHRGQEAGGAGRAAR